VRGGRGAIVYNLLQTATQRPPGYSGNQYRPSVRQTNPLVNEGFGLVYELQPALPGTAFTAYLVELAPVVASIVGVEGDSHDSSSQ
jgi:hypothetical protein